jgi:hypothetical protein
MAQRRQRPSPRGGQAALERGLTSSPQVKRRLARKVSHASAAERRECMAGAAQYEVRGRHQLYYTNPVVPVGQNGHNANSVE